MTMPDFALLRLVGMQEVDNSLLQFLGVGKGGNVIHRVHLALVYVHIADVRLR